MFVRSRVIESKDSFLGVVDIVFIVEWEFYRVGGRGNIRFIF